MSELDDLARLDATAQAELVRSKEVSAAELVDAAIARIERIDPQLNAVIHRRFDAARRDVATPTAGRAPFAGVPFLVKDALCQTAGDPYHLGMRFLKERGHRSDHDSWLAQRYRRAGFVVVGKTNLPELAMMATTEPVAYGPTANPWDLQRTPAGSSGGSAAAVAAGLVPVAHGNDMGGSIRMPAAFCGLVGLKPSYARTTLGPDFGEYWGQMSHEHVLTRSVRDCAAVLDACAGPGSGDPYVAPAPVRPWLEEVGADPGRLRVGLRTDLPGGGAPDPECAAAARSLAARLEALGHHVEDRAPRALDEGEGAAQWVPVFAVHAASELDRIGRLTGETITADDVEPSTWALAETGRTISGAQLFAAYHSMHAWSRRVASFWDDDGFDLLVTPQTGIHTPPLGVLPADLELQGRCAAFTIPFNVTGQPAMSVPTEVAGDGLPVGVQLVSAYGREDVLIRVAAQLEAAHPWQDRRPPVHA
jgi:amidase